MPCIVLWLAWGLSGWSCWTTAKSRRRGDLNRLVEPEEGQVFLVSSQNDGEILGR